MTTYNYRNIEYCFKNDHFIHFHDPTGGTHNECNLYGRTTMVRSFPERCQLTPHDFAKHVIDTLYDRQKAYKKDELKMFWASRR